MIHTPLLDRFEYTIRVLSVHFFSPDLKWNTLLVVVRVRIVWVLEHGTVLFQDNWVASGGELTFVIMCVMVLMGVIYVKDYVVFVYIFVCVVV